jgi:hypothetical protein
MELDAEAAARVTGPSTMDGIGPADDWESYWRSVDERRRAGASWATTTNSPVPGGAGVPDPGR